MPDTAMTDRAAPPQNSSWTGREILQQPQTLRATQALLAAQAPALAGFLAPLLADPTRRIVLAGAGTSSFIGECLAPALSLLLGRCVEAVPTTDLVSAPHSHLPDRPLLLVSFGRSGNSPESLAAIALANRRVTDVAHLVITCNAEGSLAQPGLSRTHAVVLPDATHDRGFAMTSSFTAMTYAALAIFTGPALTASRAEAIADAITAVLPQAEHLAAILAGMGFERAVMLGSGPLKGLAREAALKLLELTDGRIATFADSTMGFRHGPKTVLDRQTLVMVFISNDPLTRRYDIDLALELCRDARCGRLVAIASRPIEGGIETLLLPQLATAPDTDLALAAIVPAQLLALQASLALGLTPDQPNASGTVSRVVQGVRIHDAEP